MKPEFLDGADRGEVVVHVHGLHQIPRNLQIVGSGNICFPVAAAHDDHRYGFQVGIGPHLCQYLESVLPWQVQVQQNEIGTRGAGIRPFAFQEAKSFLAIADDMEIMCNSCIPQGGRGDMNIGIIVLDNQDLNWPRVDRLSSLPRLLPRDRQTMSRATVSGFCLVDPIGEKFP